MAETNSTTEPGVVAHALRALADHIERHQLPLPAEFQIDDDTRRLELHMSGQAARAWFKSVEGHVDTYDIEPAVKGSPVAWHLVEARLPDSGVRISFQWVAMARTAALA